MHRVFTCNLNLHKWGIKPTPDCILCGQIDNLEHYFYYCKEVNTFWIQISDWLSTLFNTSVNFAVLDILLGLINYTPKHFYLINYVILIGKYFISKCKRNGSNLLFNEYKYTLKWKHSEMETKMFTSNVINYMYSRKNLLFYMMHLDICKYKYASRKSRDNILLLSNLYVVFFYTEQAMFKNNCCKCSFVL